MGPNAAASTVILRHCPDYDVDRIRGVVREALLELGVVPTR